MDTNDKPKATVVNEASREYVYANGTRQTFHNVIDIRVSVSGNHYLRYRDPAGSKPHLAIVAPGWSAILIDPGEADDWTF